MHWGVWLRIRLCMYIKKKMKIVFAFRTVQTVVNNEPVASDYFLSHISNYQILIFTYGDSVCWNTDWWWFKEMTLALANLKIPWSMWILVNRGNVWKVARKRKSRISLNFTINLNNLYLASILFMWLKFTCINVHGQKCISGNQP